MIKLIIIFVIIIVWLSYEIHRAPYVDENGKITKRKNDITTKSDDTNNQEI